MELIDLVDVDTLEQLQRSFCKATGMSIGVTESSSSGYNGYHWCSYG